MKNPELEHLKYNQNNRSLTCCSSERVNVFIPTVEKDLPILPYCIEGIRKNLNHPVSKIYIIAPYSNAIIDCCWAHEIIFIPESDFSLPRPSYNVGEYDRTNWLFQQLLKLSCDTVSDTEYYFIIDSDTILIRPQAFEFDNKTVLLNSDEHHEPYFTGFRKMFGNEESTCSFVAHQMLFKKQYLAELKAELKNKFNKKWFDVLIDHTDFKSKSGLADYEIYGQWLFKHYPNNVYREYWYNKALSRSGLSEINEIIDKSKSYFKSISFHSWAK